MQSTLKRRKLSSRGDRPPRAESTPTQLCTTDGRDFTLYPLCGSTPLDACQDTGLKIARLSLQLRLHQTFLEASTRALTRLLWLLIRKKLQQTLLLLLPKRKQMLMLQRPPLTWKLYRTELEQLVSQFRNSKPLNLWQKTSLRRRLSMWRKQIKRRWMINMIQMVQSKPGGPTHSNQGTLWRRWKMTALNSETLILLESKPTLLTGEPTSSGKAVSTTIWPKTLTWCSWKVT